MKKINETMTVNEPLQIQVDKIVNVIKKNFDNIAKEMIKQISTCRPGQCAYNRSIFYYNDFNLDPDVVQFKSIDVQYYVLYCESTKDVELLFGMMMSCWYDLNTKIVTLRIPVAYYGGKLYLCVETSVASLAHELLHCFQQNKKSFNDNSVAYSFALKTAYNQKEFEHFVNNYKNEFDFLINVNYDDVKWILSALYFFDKREIDANSQRLYREGMNVYKKSTQNSDNKSLRKTFYYIKNESNLYREFENKCNEIERCYIKYKDDKYVNEFIDFLFAGSVTSVDKFKKWITTRIEYAKRKFDKVIWYIITQDIMDAALIEGDRYSLFGDQTNSYGVFESSYYAFRKFDELENIQKSRESFIKYF